MCEPGAIDNSTLNAQRPTLNAQFRDTASQLSTLNTQPSAPLPARDRRDDADLVGLLHRRLFIVEKANVLVVDEHIHEAANIALLVADALFQAGKCLVEILEDFADVAAGSLDDFELVGEFAEWCGDADAGH